MTKITCACGKVLDGTVAYTINEIVRYDKDGNVLVAICPHGVITEDNRHPTVDDLIEGNLEHLTII